MLKLYKQIEDKLHYWETWDVDPKTAVIHWGVVGERGAQRQVFSGILSGLKKIVQKEIDKQAAGGYEPIDIDDHYTLLIEYKIEGMGTAADLEKRNRLQKRMDQTLGWTGLGHCDGGSIGSETMEVCCFVVDFNIAVRIIKEDLKDTEFADHLRIYDENN